MKILYIDCSMGAAGDMLAAALLELCQDPGEQLSRLSALERIGIKLGVEKTVKRGISGSRLTVLANGMEEDESACVCDIGHHSHSICEVERIIDGTGLDSKVREDAKNVYRLIAQVEAKVHGCRPDNIHFHELGTLDAIADILTVCMLIGELSPDRICASPVHVGSGTVKCAHGELPVPAPATAQLLCGVPTYSDGIRGELCTPTGAALLKYFVDDFGAMPAMSAERIGVGVGKKDFERPNCLRATLGQSEESAIELVCNVDDMSGEDIGFALETLMAQGALDAWWQPIGMKKSRPGMLLGVLCRESDRERMLELIFRHTSTIGVREALCTRYVLRREPCAVQTPYGAVRAKLSRGYGVEKLKAELDELAELAREHGLPLAQLRSEIKMPR